MILKKCMAGVALISLLGTVACSYDHEDNRRLPPGRYESKSSYTNEYGTTIENKDATEVTVDNRGKRHTSVKSKTTKDPKGLFNKQTTHESDMETNQR